MKQRPPTSGSGPAADTRGAVDRELRRGRPGQQIAGGDRILEVVRLEPAAPLDAQLPQQGDVRRRPAEADAADPAPLPRHRRQAHLPRRRRRVRHQKSSRSAVSWSKEVTCRSESPAPRSSR